MDEHTPLKKWVVLWLSISTVIVIWDGLFVLLRPLSMPGQELGFLWSLAYSIYLEVDYTYADLHNPFVTAQVTMGLLEATIVAAALYANHRRSGPLAHLLVLVVTSLTCAKTILFFLVEASDGWANISHNSSIELIFLWVIPNGLWVVVPLAIAVDTGRRILEKQPTAP